MGPLAPPAASPAFPDAHPPHRTHSQPSRDFPGGVTGASTHSCISVSAKWSETVGTDTGDPGARWKPEGLAGAGRGW